MKLESKKYLSDIEYSIGLIEEFLEDYTFSEYQVGLQDKECCGKATKYYRGGGK